MEIERKFLIKKLPENLEQFPHLEIEQAYLCKEPVVRIRRENEHYYMTYKGKGLMVREEYNLPLSQDAYEHLKNKADGNVIHKTRYLIPEKNDLTIELDIFHDALAPLILAEVEFPTVEIAEGYQQPEWFGEEVTFSDKYHNSNLSKA